ncbi:MAG: peptidase T [Acidaminococcaceae bacterium]
MLDQHKIIQRFKNYVEIATTSAMGQTCFPSTAGQKELGRFLVQELKTLGLEQVELDEHGYVVATLPATTKEELPVIGLLAHLDTATECSGDQVKLCTHHNYDGKNLILNKEKNIVLSPTMFPELLAYVGQDLLTADGTTLLGADDKAGICIIVSVCEFLLAQPELKHGLVKIIFTPDEEIGRGTQFFPREKFAVDFAYTIDGGALGEINYETFNACNVAVKFTGRAVHPGTAKGKMLNAITLAKEWQNALPAQECPECTEGYEGFYHVTKIHGGTEQVLLEMLLRDHDAAILARRKAVVLNLAADMNARYGTGTVECVLTDVYENMKQYVLPDYGIVERAVNAMLECGVEPCIVPIRGGTDGARLSAEGLPCPNLFTGGHNFHGRFEYLPVTSLIKATEVVIKLLQVK